MAPLSEVIKEAETVAGDLLQSLPDIAGIVKKIDPHAQAIDQLVALVPRLEAAVVELEKLVGISLPEPPAPTGGPVQVSVTGGAGEPSIAGKGPIQISAPATEPKPEPPVETQPAAPEQKVAIEVTPEQAAMLGKTPIQISAPAQQ